MSRIQIAIRISSKAPPGYGKQRQLWNLFAQEADVVEQRLLRVLIPYFKRIRREVLDRLERIGPSVEGQYRGWSRRKVVEHISRKSPLDRINIDKAAERKALYQLFEPLVKISMERRGGEFVNAQLGSTIQFNVNDPEVLQYLGTRMDEFSRSVSGTTFDEIKAVLRTGFSEGQPIPTIADTLRVKFASFEKYRAPLIARTETISALNKTDLFAIAQAGIKDRLVKFWLTAGDEEVRDSHREAGKIYTAKPIAIDDLFIVGEDKDAMEAPGLGKVAKENINCRCTVGYEKIDRVGQPRPAPPAPPVKPLPKPAATILPPPPKPDVPAWADKPTPVRDHAEYKRLDQQIANATNQTDKARMEGVKAKMQEALDNIGKVHDDGPLERISLTTWDQPESGTLGRYVRVNTGWEGFDPRGELQVNIGSPYGNPKNYMETITHEVGHWIDNQGIYEGRPFPKTTFDYKKKLATDYSKNLAPGGILNEWYEALTNSKAYKEYKSLRVKAQQQTPVSITEHGIKKDVYLDADYMEYAMRDREMFARSYMQYIATKTQNKEMLDAIAAVRGKDEIFQSHQWDDDDFKPIADAFDNLFKKLGWAK